MVDYLSVISGLKAQILDGIFYAGSETNADHLRWMMDYCVDNIQTMPIGKLNRWIGFVQGVLATHGILNVNAERDRTRPFFKGEI